MLGLSSLSKKNSGVRPGQLRVARPLLGGGGRAGSGGRQVAVGQNQWDHVGVGEFTTHVRSYFSGWIESDVHWGLTDLAFDPWPYGWLQMNELGLRRF